VNAPLHPGTSVYLPMEARLRNSFLMRGVHLEAEQRGSSVCRSALTYPARVCARMCVCAVIRLCFSFRVYGCLFVVFFASESKKRGNARMKVKMVLITKRGARASWITASCASLPVHPGVTQKQAYVNYYWKHISEQVSLSPLLPLILVHCHTSCISSHSFSIPWAEYPPFLFFFFLFLNTLGMELLSFFIA